MSGNHGSKTAGRKKTATTDERTEAIKTRAELTNADARMMKAKAEAVNNMTKSVKEMDNIPNTDGTQKIMGLSNQLGDVDGKGNGAINLGKMALTETPLECEGGSKEKSKGKGTPPECEGSSNEKSEGKGTPRNAVGLTNQAGNVKGLLNGVINLGNVEG